MSTVGAKPKVGTWIDNRPGNSLLEAIGALMGEAQALDIATGFFEFGAFVDLDGKWQGLQNIRLLMGDELTRATKKTFLEVLKRQNGLDRVKEQDDWKAIRSLTEVVEALASNKIEARVYTKAKFHAKCYHFYTTGVVDHGVFGSSNFTHAGLTQNIELNYFTSDRTYLGTRFDPDNRHDTLGRWYQRAWDEAEPLKEELLEILEPHIRPYHPFEVYIRAMRERFHGLEADGTSWEATESVIYPELAKYQKDAYHDLMHMAKTWGGGLLCDGVGLGKTFVGLMLIERARHDRHKVLVVAPNAAIPSVWERNLTRFLPDDFHKYTDDIKVVPHTDFGREGGISDDDIEKLRKRYDTIVIDEAHHFRNTNRNRSKRMKALCEGKRVFLLTATPVNNSLIDLYNLLNYIAQDNQRKFEPVGVPHLRRWFSERDNEKFTEQLTLDLHDSVDYRAFLKHVMVQRSRTYVKGIEKDFDQSIKFPTRERPEVVEYSLGAVYQKLLPPLLDALNPKKPRLSFAIYETERYKEKKEQKKEAIDFQSNVVSLIRIMLLKRLESSEKALEASVEDLLMKHVAVLRAAQPMKAETWLSQFADVYEVMATHRRERLGGDEEEDDIPLTPFEGKKVAEIMTAIHLFGNNLEKWQAAIESDMTVLGNILRALHQQIGPANDAKLQAFLTKIRTTPRLQKSKFVVFSEFKDTARYLEEQLKLAFPDAQIVEVDSGRNVKNREVIIRRFSPHYNCVNERELKDALADPIRILISTDVLSEGLNLQDANVIVNYDIHWNPVRLMQRIGRVDRRMDPAKPVQYDKVYVYNFLCPDELEEIIKVNAMITGKLMKINRALGIEAPVLNPDDEHQVMDFYLNLGEGQMSETERLRRLALQLEREHPELWERTATYPNRIYSGKASTPPRPFGERGLGGDGSVLRRHHVMLVHGQTLHRLPHPARPDHLGIHRTLMHSQSKVQRHVVLVAFAGARFDLPRDHATPHPNPHLRPDHRPSPAQLQGNPCVARCALVDEQLPRAHEVEITIPIEICPRRLIRRRQLRQPRARRHIRKLKPTAFSEQHRVVRFAK